MVTMHGDIEGAHWSDLEELLPLYRAVTERNWQWPVDQLLGGQMATPWADERSLPATLQPCCQYRSISEASVADILADGVRGHLVPRLTTAARTELTEVQEILQSVVLTEEDDRRTCPLSTDRQSLQSGPIYHSADDTHSWRPPCCFLQFRVGEPSSAANPRACLDRV
jgi:hypothetical protein